MPRTAHLANHYTVQELKKKYLKSEDKVESRRWHLLWKIALGWTIKNSAIAVGINYGYAKKIVKKYNNLGEEGVKNCRKNPKNQKVGRKALLTETQLLKLQEKLESSPPDGGIWTGPKVARWIEKETGKEKVWNQRGWDYLKKCKYSWQRPRPTHNKGDKLEQENFKDNLWLKVKELEQKYPEAEVELWFFDEHRIGLKPILKKVWSKIGDRPIAIVSHRYEWVYVYGFVKPKTGETLWYLIPRVNTEWLNLVYKNFAKDVGIAEKKIVLLIEDNAGWHRSKKVVVPEGIKVEFLPPYSPELQPAERLWKLVDEPLVNKYFETIEEIEEILVNRCTILMDMSEEIKSLTNYHWLAHD
ncbi:IS630 family transposase [Moorena sp. SIO3H5]|uniref:IS630 family transposase n=1 Tax=Moorena sp. SIO3H5 TaxID=2607834 RepID=UPI0013B7F556|nr:IS630 family transposase [Moorena sp. SIO3H5]NEO74635.1 IS630 family transposase [Moorena sp. SIO3H5]